MVEFRLKGSSEYITMWREKDKDDWYNTPIKGEFVSLKDSKTNECCWYKVLLNAIYRNYTICIVKKVSDNLLKYL